MSGKGEGGWLGALAVAVGVAEVGTRVLRPRDAPPRVEPVDAGEYFTEAELGRARAYGRPQMAMGAANTVIRAGVLSLLVRRGRRHAGGRPRRGAAGVAGEVAGGVGLSLGLTVASLPLTAVMRRRAVDAGLATQSWGGWAEDLAKSSLIGATFAGAGAATVLGLMRRAGDRWWVGAAAGSVGLSVVFMLGAPVVLDPIFNRFTRLEPGETRDDVLELAQAAGVGVQDVYSVDASRRTTTVNAYVTGLGATRRVVLYDTLMASFSREETRLVVAHELAHVRHRDVSRGLAQMGLAAPAAMFAVARLTGRLDASSEPGRASFPALALALGIVGAPVGALSNKLSRAVERRADAFSLRLTDAPQAFTSFAQRIVVANLADPDPPLWFNVLATHPPAVERIAIARAHAAESAAGDSSIARESSAGRAGPLLRGT